MEKQLATFEDFSRLDIRVGTILTAQPFPKARRPAYQLTVDFGPKIGVKKSSAQITDHYRPEDLPGIQDRKSTRLTSSHYQQSRMPSSA